METNKVDKILFKVSAGDYLHTYSLYGIQWSVTREMAPIYTADDPRAYSRNRRSIAGALVPEISIRLDEPIVGYIVIHADGETVILEDVKILNEGGPCNQLVADCLMTFVAGKIVGDVLGKSFKQSLFTYRFSV